MKRLTYYSMKGSENDGWYLKSGVSKQDAVDRLAAYENSKLEPEEIKSLQADVAPVRHGKWIWDPNGMDFGLGAWECSECAVINNNLPVNVKVNPFLFSGSNYCPNCGARMDEEE